MRQLDEYGRCDRIREIGDEFPVVPIANFPAKVFQGIVVDEREVVG